MTKHLEFVSYTFVLLVISFIHSFELCENKVFGLKFNNKDLRIYTHLANEISHSDLDH